LDATLVAFRTLQVLGELFEHKPMATALRVHLTSNGYSKAPDVYVVSSEAQHLPKIEEVDYFTPVAEYHTGCSTGGSSSSSQPFLARSSAEPSFGNVLLPPPALGLPPHAPHAVNGSGASSSRTPGVSPRSPNSAPLAQLGDCLLRTRMCQRGNGRQPFCKHGAALTSSCISHGSEVPEDLDCSFVSTSTTSDFPIPSSMGCNTFSEDPAEGHEVGSLTSQLCSRMCIAPRNHFQFNDEVVHAGSLEKRSRHLGMWRDRWAVLTPKCLYTFKGPVALHSPPTDVIKLDEILGIAMLGKRVLLRLRWRKFELRFLVTAIAETWTQLILECCDRLAMPGTHQHMTLPRRHAEEPSIQ
jgi:hypothetical protein